VGPAFWGQTDRGKKEAAPGVSALGSSSSEGGLRVKVLRLREEAKKSDGEGLSGDVEGGGTMGLLKSKQERNISVQDMGGGSREV